MAATGRLQQGVVVQAYLTEIEPMAEGIRATMSRLAPKGKYTFIDDQGAERAVELLASGLKGGKRKGELHWRA